MSDLALHLRVGALAAAYNRCVSEYTARAILELISGAPFDDDDREVIQTVAGEFDAMLEAAVEQALTAGLYGGPWE